MKCLVDNNLPPALARALDALSASKFPDLEQVIALRDRFPRNTPDVTWIQALGQEGNWFLLSADQFRKHGDLERKALRQSGLIVFCLSKQWSAQQYWEECAHLLQWWPHIVDQAERLQGGAAFRVPWKLSGGKPKFEQIPF
ncbi:MAG: hypothetical protein RKO66_08235 [Candidatus Contendobacter sp.]|nr:hypothetical protein [Candidatus Contendobacter sp.]MDS4057760.1 hypothetical protein [Candidatus Contendobacter sp.]